MVDNLLSLLQGGTGHWVHQRRITSSPLHCPRRPNELKVAQNSLLVNSDPQRGHGGESNRITRSKFLTGGGAPGRIRTCDPRLRRPLLYPAELRAQTAKLKNWSGMRDLNPRHPAPKAGALPDCAIPRLPVHYTRKKGITSLIY